MNLSPCVVRLCVCVCVCVHTCTCLRCLALTPWKFALGVFLSWGEFFAYRTSERLGDNDFLISGNLYDGTPPI